MKPLCMLLVLLSLSCDTHKDFSREELTAVGHLYTRQFYSSDLEALHRNFAEKSFTLQDLRDFRLQVENELGSEVEVYDEMIDTKIWQNKRYYGYVRHSKFSKTDLPVRTLFAFDRDKVIVRFEVTMIADPAPSKYENYSIKTDIQYPFEGEWYVASGGRSPMHNHHTVLTSTRYAIDFMIRKEDSYYHNTGRRNEDYYCYNQKVLAPGAGIIVSIVNHIPENAIGVKPPDNPGNMVVIDHQNGEFSFLCHFKQGSICVDPGDSVSKGQYLGLCGNSGLSYAPHIHYHMQDSPIIFEGEGLPIKFRSYYSDNSWVAEGEPEWGDYVKNL